MQVLQSILLFLSNQDTVTKFILIILLALYGLFALVLTNQIRVLSGVINQVRFSPLFLALAYVHTTLAVLLLVGIVVLL